MSSFTLSNTRLPWEGVKCPQPEKKFRSPAETTNWWKPKELPVQPPPQPSPPPLHHRLQEAFHALQSHISNFLQKPQNHLGMSDEQIGDQLSMVPVYGIKEGNKRKSNLGYFFNKSDAMEFSESEFIRSSFPLRENFVVSEALDDVMDYHTEEGPVRLIPDAYEVKNALQVKKKASLPDDTFSGIPVFESRNLSIWDHYLHLTNEGCLNQRRPVFFKKEDLEKSLAKARAASHDERSNLIDTEAHIEVAALEDIIQAMKDDSTSEWNNVFFAYPGEDIRTGPTSLKSKKGRRRPFTSSISNISKIEEMENATI